MMCLVIFGNDKGILSRLLQRGKLLAPYLQKLSQILFGRLPVVLIFIFLDTVKVGG